VQREEVRGFSSSGAAGSAVPRQASDLHRKAIQEVIQGIVEAVAEEARSTP